MNISVLYDIEQITVRLEQALQIDGKDYAERNIDKVIADVKKRIIVEYHVDLTNTDMRDPTLFVGQSRNKAGLFVENIGDLHAKLCGYLQIVRFTKTITVRPVNINWLGCESDNLKSILKCCCYESEIPKVDDAMEVIKTKIGSIGICIEKKLFLLMVISRELGFYEATAAIAEILYLGCKY